jgi:predicted DNA-binding protein
VGFYPSREVKDRLTRAAEQENRSVSNLVCQIVEEYLEAWGDEIGGDK